MAHRSKQNKPCPAKHCKFPTKNRQSPLRQCQLKEIAQIDRTIIPELEGGQICSYCGCVYVFSGKHKVIKGYHDDPRVEGRHSLWWEIGTLDEDELNDENAGDDSGA